MHKGEKHQVVHSCIENTLLNNFVALLLKISCFVVRSNWQFDRNWVFQFQWNERKNKLFLWFILLKICIIVKKFAKKAVESNKKYYIFLDSNWFTCFANNLQILTWHEAVTKICWKKLRVHQSWRAQTLIYACNCFRKMLRFCMAWNIRIQTFLKTFFYSGLQILLIAVTTPFLS